MGSSHGCNTSGPSGGEPSQFNDSDPHDDEYVGFNDEGMYNSDGDDGFDQNHNAKSAAQDLLSRSKPQSNIIPWFSEISISEGERKAIKNL
jgi:hypothetical protein